MRNEGYGIWSVRLCVLLTLTLELQATKRHAYGIYTRLQRNNRSKNNVADLAKTAEFWQEKPAPPWIKFRDPTHQLSRCSCVFITCTTGSQPPEQHSCVSQLLAHAAPVAYTNRVCAEGLHFSAFSCLICFQCRR